MGIAADRRVILGSGSPRRRELLSGLGVDFVVDTGNSFEESMEPGTPASEIPVHMSVGKSHGFHRPLEEGEVLITSDTVVIVDDKPVGKPHDREDAVRMLKSLSGRTHEVVTAVTLRDCRHEKTFTDSTLVTFTTLSDGEILDYVDRYRPFDKAGAYGVQEWIGYIAISRLEGSFYNVMGFPTHKVYKELINF